MNQEGESQIPDGPGAAGDNSSILAESVGCLGIAILTPNQAGELATDLTFEIVGEAPGWWKTWMGEADSIFERSPFLEDFVTGEARDFWENPDSEGARRSGLWEEPPTESPAETVLEAPRFFEATASRTASGTALLLIEPADERLIREREYVQSVHDLNLERRRLRKELEKKQILLECITHDLANPLATVLLNLQHVARQIEDQPHLEAPIQRAIGQAKRQSEMVRSISEIFAADLASMRTPNSFGAEFPDLVAVSAKVISACAGSASESSVTLCPIFTSPLHVVGDALYLSRIIENLIVNGIRYTPEGGTVMIGFGEEDGYAVCRVEDGGKGIDPEEVDEIFEPFGQGRGRHKGQSGLGLYFCRLTAEMWGGRIEVWNRPEGGACFEVWLPRASSEDAADSPQSG